MEISKSSGFSCGGASVTEFTLVQHREWELMRKFLSPRHRGQSLMLPGHLVPLKKF